jgi:hypothetical protein
MSFTAALQRGATCEEKPALADLPTHNSARWTTGSKNGLLAVSISLLKARGGTVEVDFKPH